MFDINNFDSNSFDYEEMEREEGPFAARLMTWIANRCQGPLVDLGAGTGIYVQEARSHGWVARGYDIADPQPRPDLVETRSLLDVTDPARTVLCIEVAEHIPEEQSQAVLESVWRNCLPGAIVIWSAARPGQGGVGHINCQPPNYWHLRAEDMGFTRRWDLEEDLHNWITNGYHMGWFASNRQIWQRPE